MTTLTKALAAAALLTLAGTASADTFLGGGLTFSQYEYDDLDDGNGFSLFATFKGTESPWMGEIAYYDGGDADVEGLNGVSLNHSGFKAYAGFGGFDELGSGFWLKAGLYSGDTEISGPGGSADESASGLALGLGGDWMFSESVGARFDLEILFGVEDFVDDEDVTLITVGLVFGVSGDSD